MGKIYLVRHGETEWNKEQRSQGCSNDIPLSIEGIIQARALGLRLKNEQFDFIYSSILQRANQTAEEIALYHGIKVNKLQDFMEINFGIWEGMRVPEIKKSYGDIFECWRKTPENAIVPGAERLQDVKIRCMDKLYELLYQNPKSNILIVSHGISIKVMIASILGISLNEIHRIRQDNTALNIFDYNEGIMDIITINDIGHLKGSDSRNLGSFEMK